MILNYHLRNKILFIILTMGMLFGGMLFGCKNDAAQEWQIGKGFPMRKTLVELDEPRNIKICSDEYKHIGFPINLHIDYDDQRYYGLIEGLCITVNAKVVKVKIATPSSGKMARGTFEILEE